MSGSLWEPESWSFPLLLAVPSSTGVPGGPPHLQPYSGKSEWPHAVRLLRRCEWMDGWVIPKSHTVGAKVWLCKGWKGWV